MSYVFVLGWTIVVMFVLINMFIAILMDAHSVVQEQNRMEEQVLEPVGKNATYGLVSGFLRSLKSRLGKIDPDDLTIYDHNDETRSLHDSLKRINLREAEQVRQAVLSGKPIDTETLS